MLRHAFQIGCTRHGHGSLNPNVIPCLTPLNFFYPEVQSFRICCTRSVNSFAADTWESSSWALYCSAKSDRAPSPPSFSSPGSWNSEELAVLFADVQAHTALVCPHVLSWCMWLLLVKFLILWFADGLWIITCLCPQVHFLLFRWALRLSGCWLPRVIGISVCKGSVMSASWFGTLPGSASFALYVFSWPLSLWPLIGFLSNPSIEIRHKGCQVPKGAATGFALWSSLEISAGWAINWMLIVQQVGY